MAAPPLPPAASTPVVDFEPTAAPSPSMRTPRASGTRARPGPSRWSAKTASARYVEPGKPVRPKHDGFHGEQGARVRDGFDPKLMEFVKTARLWAFGSEIGAHVVEAPRLRLQLHTGVEVTTDDGGRPLRPQRQRTPAAVAEGEHLLAHDVGPLTHSEDKQAGRFGDGGFDALVAEPPGLVFRGSLHRDPV